MSSRKIHRAFTVKKKIGSKEVIIVEVFPLESSDLSNIYEIPINKDRKSSEEVNLTTIYECGGCMTPEEFAKSMYYSYILSARAFRMGMNKANVGFQIDDEEGCKTQKVLHVYRNQKKSFKLKCVRVVARYGLAGETSAETAEDEQ